MAADDKERDARTQAAIQHVLDTQRAQYQRELAWEREHPPPPAGPPEKLHVFFDEPQLPAPAARSAIGRKIAIRAHRWQQWQERKAAAEKARAAVKAELENGLIEGVTLRSREDADPVVAVPASAPRRRRAARD